MPIVCRAARAVLFPIPSPRLDGVKSTLYLLDRPDASAAPKNVNRLRGYKTLPVDPAEALVPDGYASFAVVQDPLAYLVDIWTKFGGHFHPRPWPGATDGAPERPSFREFLAARKLYAAAHDRLGLALRPFRDYLGDDLARYDAVFDVGDRAAIAAWLAARAEASDVPPIPPGRPPVPVVLDDAGALIDAATAENYALLSNRYASDASPALPRSGPAGAPLPTVSAPAAAPDPRLAVACLIAEPPEVVDRFIAHYTRIGAAEIRLYFDRPDDASLSRVAANPAVRAIPCDDDFWHAARPSAVEGRQTACYAHAYAHTGAEWLTVCDADEFITASRPLPALLDAAPPDQRVIRAASHEAVWARGTDPAPFTAGFARSGIWGAAWREFRTPLYGKLFPLFRWGLLSHRSGKYLVRTGLAPDRLGIHVPSFPDGANEMRPASHHVQAILIHFDAISRDHWQKKMERRLKPKHGFYGMDAARRAQILALREMSPLDFAVMFDRLYCLDQRQRDLLAAHGSLKSLSLFPGLVETCHG